MNSNNQARAQMALAVHDSRLLDLRRCALDYALRHSENLSGDVDLRSDDVIRVAEEFLAFMTPRPGEPETTQPAEGFVEESPKLPGPWVEQSTPKPLAKTVLEEIEVNDGHFVFDLRRNRNVTSGQIDRVRAFMRDYVSSSVCVV